MASALGEAGIGTSVKDLSFKENQTHILTAQAESAI